MKILKILLISLLTLAITSCEKEDSDYLESNDLKYQIPPINPYPKNPYRSLCSTSLNFNLVTDRVKMGKFAATEMVEYQGRIWSVGGYLNGRTYPNQTSQIWSSSDAVNWRLEASNVFDARVNHSLTVFDNKLWVIGGFSTSTHLLADVWYSSDGRNWTLATDTPEFGGIASHKTLVFKDHLVVFNHNEIWASPTGRNWRKVAKNMFSPRNRSEFKLFNDVMYIIGGEDGNGSYFNEIWQSTNGKIWTQVTTNGSLFSPRSRLSTAIYQDKFWVIGGTLETGYDSDEIWFSKNMTDWCKYKGSVPITKLSSHSSLQLDNSILIFGGFSAYGVSSKIWAFQAN